MHVDAPTILLIPYIHRIDRNTRLRCSALLEAERRARLELGIPLTGRLLDKLVKLRHIRIIATCTLGLFGVPGCIGALVGDSAVAAVLLTWSSAHHFPAARPPYRQIRPDPVTC